MKQLPPPNKRKGGWIGIDLGTSNCTAAVWDLDRSRCKVLRLGYKNLARPPSDGSKGGKIVPSAVLFINDGDDKVGYEAISNLDNDDSTDETTCNASSALVTSFKRVVGMTSSQAKELQLSDGEFWDSLPFQPVIINEEESDEVPILNKSNQSENVAFDLLGDTANDGTQEQSLSTNESSAKTDKKEGVAIRIKPNGSKNDRLVGDIEPSKRVAII